MKIKLVVGDALDAADLNGNFANLQAQITAAQHPPSAFHATLTNSASLTSGVITPIAFNHVEVDLGTEYTAGTGAFVPKYAGVYTLNCGVGFVTTSSTASQWSVNLFKNGNTEIVGTDLEADASGAGVRPEVTVIAELAAGDSVVCRAYQSTGSTQAINVNANFPGRHEFSAARLY